MGQQSRYSKKDLRRLCEARRVAWGNRRPQLTLWQEFVHRFTGWSVWR